MKRLCVILIKKINYLALPTLFAAQCPDRTICKNNGDCILRGNSLYCQCPQGFYGVLCESVSKLNALQGQRVQIEIHRTDVFFTFLVPVSSLGCTPNPCKNHGTCKNYDNGEFYSCFCQIGYNGQFCEIPPSTYK